MSPFKNHKGRNFNPVWAYFSSSSSRNGPKPTSNACKFCNLVISHHGHVDRARDHLLKSCQKISRNDLEAIRSTCGSSHDEDTQSSWTPADQTRFDELFALFVYSNNLAFNIVNYTLIEDLFKLANPKITLPSRHHLSTTLLDRTYEKVRSDVITRINDSPYDYTLQNDATTDVSKTYLVIPGGGSQLRCVANVLKSYDLILVQMVKDTYLTVATNKQIDERNELKARFVSFKEKMLKFVDIISPITFAIEKFENNKTPISEVITVTKKIEEEILKGTSTNEEEKIEIKKKLSERKAFIVRKNHKMALLLDPRFRFTDFYAPREESDTLNSVKNYFIQCGEAVTPDCVGHEFEAYRLYVMETFKQGDHYHDAMMREKDPMHPLHFWFERANLWPKLSQLALRLFSQVCSSAETERTFSQWLNIHTKQRNRLDFQRTEKLLFIEYNFRSHFNKMREAEK